MSTRLAKIHDWTRSPRGGGWDKGGEELDFVFELVTLNAGVRVWPVEEYKEG